MAMLIIANLIKYITAARISLCVQNCMQK